MKLFTAMQIREAVDFSARGGQALHVWFPCAGLTVFGYDEDRAPTCFRNAAKAGKPFGHLLDQDEPRLVETARSLGVGIIIVHRQAETHQHVDLCGRPLERAVEMARQEAAEEWNIEIIEPAKAAPPFPAHDPLADARALMIPAKFLEGSRQGSAADARALQDRLTSEAPS